MTIGYLSLLSTHFGQMARVVSSGEFLPQDWLMCWPIPLCSIWLERVFKRGGICAISGLGRSCGEKPLKACGYNCPRARADPRTYRLHFLSSPLFSHTSRKMDKTVRLCSICGGSGSLSRHSLATSNIRDPPAPSSIIFSCVLLILISWPTPLSLQFSSGCETSNPLGISRRGSTRKLV